MRRRHNPSELSKTRLRLETLERRVLFSADLPFVADALGAFDPTTAPIVGSTIAGNELETESQQAQPLELVVVDPSADDFESVLQEAEARSGSGFQAYLLNPDVDGLAQLSEILTEHRNVSALHLLTAGTGSEITLGGSTVTLMDMLANADEVAGWGESFAAESSWQIYGSGMADSDEGMNFVTTLSDLTGTDVAVSSEFAVSAWARPVATGEVTETEAAAESTDSAVEERLELVFIDTDTDDYEQLLDDLLAEKDDGRQIEVILLDKDRDGVEQISETLALYQDVDAVHLISHGTEGGVQLGDTWLSSDTLSSYEAQLASWSNALSEDADLLFYGCDLAGSKAGETLVASIAQLTGADAAASTDLTGDADQGGDWELEFTVGQVESELAVSAALQQEYQGTFATYTVTSLADSGAGSLREAITLSNASGGADTIEFGVAGTITLSSLLPSIDSQVSIDGTTAPGYSGDPLVEIDGNSVSGNGLRFEDGSDGSIVRGLMITNISGNGIHVDTNTDGVVIQGNWIGTTGTGTTGDGNSNNGIDLQGTNTIIGGTGPNDGNVITNNGNEGINIRAGATGTVIQGNIIGLDPDGSTGTGNGDIGIALLAGADDTTIGGTDPNAGNVISMNFEGIEINSNNNIVQGNYIGTDITGTLDRGNDSDDGIEIQNNATGNLIGGTEEGAGNLIAFNQLDGINLVSGSGNAVLGNDIYSNGDQQIDLAAGANGDQAAPILTSAQTNGSELTIAGSLSSTANSYFRIEFFGADQTYLGFVNVATDGSGNATFNTTLNVSVASGTLITSSATKSDAAYSTFTDTSAFSSTVVSGNAGTAIWRDASTTPQTSDWDGSSFGSTTATAPSGDYRIMQGAESPTRDEVIVIGVTESSEITGEIWDGSSWSVLPGSLGSPLGTVTQSYWWGMDVQYESQSGDALMVWTDGGNIEYATWDGSSWSAVSTITYGGATPRHLQLASSPNSDEMVLVVSDTNSSDRALVWDGSSWGNEVLLDAGSGDDRTDVNVIYRQQSGDAVVVYGAGSTNLQTRVWDGTNWGTPMAFVSPVGVTGDVRWTTVAADPNSDNIAVGVVTSSSETWVGIVDGVSWSATEMSSTASSTVAPVIDVAFESTSGELLTAYAESGSSNVKYQTWTSGGGWSGEQLGPNIGGTPNSLTLSSDPQSDSVMLMAQDGNSDVNSSLWNGSAWGGVTELGTSTTETKNQPFLFLWDQQAVINDAPVNALPATQNTAIDTALVFSSANGNAISITDTDDTSVEVTLSATNGLLTLSGTTGLSFSAGDGTGDIDMTFSGTLADINAALDGLQFDPTAAFEGFASVQISTTDSGAGGATSAENDTDAVTIEVGDVNSAPVNTVPGAQAIETNGMLLFSTATGSAISVGDADAGSAAIQVTLAATNGTLNLASANGLTFSIGDGSADTTMTFTGTIADINAALEGMTFVATPGFTGTAGVQITTDDLGNSGAGGAQTDTDTISIDVQPRDSALWLTFASDETSGGAPGQDTWTGGEVLQFGGSLAFEPGSTSGTLSAVFDLDDPAFSDGDTIVNALHQVSQDITVGTNSFQLYAGDILLSTQAAENLTGLSVSEKSVFVFHPDTPGDYSSGTFTLLIDGNDLGLSRITGITLVEQATTVGDVTLNAGEFLLAHDGSNKNIIRFEPGALGDATGGTLSILVAGDDIGMGQPIHSIELIEQTTQLGNVTLQAGQILLSLKADDSSVGSSTPIAVTKFDIFMLDVTATGDGTSVATATLLFEGADVNLDNGGKEDIWGVSLNVSNNTPEADDSVFSIDENSANGTVAGSVSAGDPDTGDTLNYAIVGGNATGAFAIDATTGQISVADSTLLDFETTPSFSLTVAAIDPQGAYDTATITINLQNLDEAGVNDSPENTVPAAQTIQQDGMLAFSATTGTAISISDFDAGSGLLEVTLNATNGTLNLSGTNGLAFIVGDGSADATMTFTGTLADINAALEGMTFVATPGFTGAAGVQITTDDQGNTGTGGALVDTDSVAISVIAADSQLWLTFENDEGGTGSSEIPSITGGDVVTFSDITQLETSNSDPLAATSAGTLAYGFNLDTVLLSDGVTLASDGNTIVNAVHYVGSDIQVGSNNIQLQAGDILLSTDADETIDGVTYNNDDVFVFRPDTPGDYSRGSFFLLIDGNAAGLAFNNVTAISLVEQTTSVGGVTLNAGEFLFAHDGASKNILRFAPGSLGDTTTGTTTVFVAGGDVDIDQSIGGLHLVQNDTELGGVSLTSGQLLVSIQGNDSTVGSGTTIDVLRQDIFVLDVSATGAGTSAATASRLFEGLDESLDGNNESIWGIGFQANAAPEVSADSFTLDENSAGGTVVGSVTATDPEQGTLIYAITGGNTGGAFAIDASTGQITVANSAALDFETTPTFTLTVAAIDPQGAYGSAAITVNLNDLVENTPPTTSSISDFTVNEDVGFSFLDLNAVFEDIEDADSALVYSIENNTNPGLFDAATINGSGVLTLDYAADQNGTADITIRATDTGGLWIEESFTVTVNPVNDAPVLIAGTVDNLTVIEDSGLTSLGLTGVTYSTGGGSDESGQTLSYSVTAIPAASAGDVFLVDGVTRVTPGVYTLAEIRGMQFRPADDWSGTTAFQFNVTDSGGTSNGGTDSISQFILITVDPVNDAPVFTSPASFSITENSTAVGTVTSTDVDGGAPQYTLVGAVDDGLFSIDANSGVLSFNTAPDYESPTDTGGDNVYNLTVQVTDGNGSIVSQAISVTVTDVSSNLVVTTTADLNDGDTSSAEALNASKGADSAVSLSEAITAANNSTETVTISFNITDPLVNGAHTFAVGAGGLPAITSTVIIDGTTDPDYAGTPIIVLDGSAAGAVDGLRLAAGSDGSVIRGLVINQFGDTGITLVDSDNHTIVGNYIGTDVTGTVDLGNTSKGIQVENSSGNQIGGSTAADRNVIAGNDDDGIILWGAGSTLNVIQGNYIGVDATGNAALGNSGDGIAIAGGANDNTIGGDRTAGEGNVLSGNSGAISDGIEIDNAGADNNRIYGNYIGTNHDGTVAIANARHGVVIYDGVQATEVGGTGTGEGNIISGNTQHGVVIDANGVGTTSGNVIQANIIGLDVTGTAVLGNGDSGIRIFGGAGANTIGGASAEARNVISGNVDGIYIQTADGTIIQGNYIGTDVTGLIDLGNSDRGVQLESGADNTIIGGTAALAGNVISGNNNDGIIISDGSSPGIGVTGVVIQGNYIGVGADGTTAVGNGTNGVRITTESGHLIGGTIAGAGNTIAHNSADGVMLQNSSADANSILGNVIYSNGQQGIDLGNDGVTTNDANDTDSGANNLQNFPVVTQADLSGTNLTLSGTLDTDGISTQYRVEFFGNPAGTEDASHGEARVFLGAVTVTTDGTGSATFSNVTLSSVPLTTGDFVTATATEIPNPSQVGTDDALAYGSTSEFAANVAITDANVAPTFTSPPIITATEDVPYSYTITTSDADGDVLNINGLTVPAWLTLTDNGDGTATLSGTPTNAEVGNHSVSLEASDGSLTSTQNFTLTVSNVNDDPVFTSPASFTVPENTTTVGTVTSTDVDGGAPQYTLVGAVDDSLFSIDVNSGALSFNAAPDFEAPTDIGGDNVYNLTVQVNDGSGGIVNQAISVTVTDVSSNLVVTTTADLSDGDTSSAEALNASKGADSAISLAEAITAANNSAETVTISFNITDPLVNGAHTFAIGAGGLPAITDTVIIDGTTDPDYAGTPIIELDGSAAGAGISGLTLDAGSDGSTIRGLVINRFAHSGIRIEGSDNNTIYGNYIGTDASGDVQSGSDVQATGITVNDASGNLIGGTAPADANVLSGNRLRGVMISGSTSTDNVVSGNLIGTNADGSAALTNVGSGQQIGIYLLDTPGNTIGGTAAGAENLISGNITYGIYAWGANANGNEIQGNIIGLDATLSTAIGNGTAGGGGILLSSAPDNLIGGTTAGAENIISGHLGSGIIFGGATSIGNTALGNTIYDNGGLGIDLGADGVTANDAGDADAGANDLQNFPVITSAELSGTDLILSGSLDTDGLTTQYRIEFFGNAAGTEDSTNGEAGVFLGAITVTTDGSGNATFSNVTLSGGSLSIGDSVTASVTEIIDPGQIGTDDTLAYGSTSEFATNVTIVELNVAPTFTSTPFTAATEDALYSYAVTTSDANGDALTINGLTVPAWLTLTDNGDGTATLTGTPTNAEVGDHSVSLEVSDGSLTATQSFTLTVTNVNDNPVFTSPASFSVAENATAVGTVTSTDVDGGAPQYTLVGAVDDGLFSIDVNSGALSFNAAPDFEAPADSGGDNVYNLTVQVNDGNGGIVNQSVSVTVTNVNESGAGPISDIDAIGDTVAEDATVGTTVGITADATDTDAGDTVTYSLDDDAGGLFAIDTNSGVVTVNGGLDYETATSHEITVRATSTDTSFSTRTFTITVGDVNDNAPVMTAAQTFSVNEDALVNDVVGNVAATDVDTVGSLQGWTITAGNTDGIFAINASTGQITIADPTNLNFEATPQYTLTVQVSDGVNTSATETVVIDIVDVNEAPVFDSTSVTVATEDALYSYTITTSDVDGDVLSINGLTVPAWLTLTDNGDGTATLTGTPTNAEVGDHSVSLEVSDGSLTATQNFTLTVSNVNDEPVFTSPANFSVAENATAVGTVTSTDVDGGAPQYTLVGAVDDGLFSIDINSGALSFNAAPDFEAPADSGGDNVYDLTVQVDDGNGGIVNQAITVTVTDANEIGITAISDTDAALETVAENALPGATVGITAFADDADGTDTVSYSLDDDAGGLFTIDTNSGVVIVNGGLDYETASSHNITVRATSTDGSFSTRAFSIVVSDVNETGITAIGDTDAALDTVAEDALPGTNVGITAFADDADGTDTVSYSLDDDAGGLFTVDALTGAVTVNGALDYESSTGHNIILRATSTDGSTTTRSFSIGIGDVNDNAPVVTAAQTFSINEDAVLNDVVGSVAATDVDTVGSLQGWAITAGNTDGIFAINASTGQITIADPTNLNHETTPQYTLTVQVSDGVNTSATETVVIDVNDVNEAPVFDSTPVTAATEDALYTYTITTSDVDGNVLSINGLTVPAWLTLTDNGNGTATLTGTPTNAEVGDHSVSLEVSDGSLTATQSFTLTVSNVNDAPVFTSPASFSVAENSTAVGTVTTTDLDGGAPQYSLVGAVDDGLFSIDVNSGALSFNAAPDFESPTDSGGDNVYDLTVQVDDGNGGIVNQSVSVTVTNVNETGASAIVDNNGAADAISEDATIGTAVGITAFADDADTGDSVTYSLDDDAGGLFTIDSNTGVVTVNGTLDYETATSHDITVRATSTDTSFSTQNFTIAVGDVNDNAPVVTAAQTFNVNEDAVLNDVVGSVVATDPDTVGGLQGWTITAGNAEGIFQINGTTGEITIADPTNLNFEATPQYTLTVQVSDGVNTSATETVVIDIVDVNEAPTFTSAPLTTATEDVAYSYTITTSDVDGDVLSINGLTVPAWLTLTDNGDGTATLTGTPTNAEVGDHSVSLEVSDGSLTATQSFTLTVTNVNDDPVFTSPASFSVAENATAVGTVTSTDVDGGAPQYTLIGAADDGLFSIDLNSGALSFNAAPDFEAPADNGGDNVYDLTVQVDDGNGGIVTQAVAVTVTNVNEAGVSVIGDTDAAIDTVAEDATVGTTVGITADASDSDAGDTVTYSLDDDAGGLFAIDSNTGVVTVAGALDYETATSHNITVRATSTDTSFTTRTFTIAVGDVNDNAPVVTAAQTFSVNEDALVNDVVGNVAATDVDTVGSLQGWTITAGNTDGIFQINGTTGEISIADPTNLNFEATPQYTLTVQVSDGVNTSATESVVINVNDVNETPNLPILSVSTVDENIDTSAGYTLGTLSAPDVDAGDTLTFEVVGGLDSDVFSIGGLNGDELIMDDGLLDYERQSSYEVRIRVTDSGGLSSERDFAITVNDLNDAPLPGADLLTVMEDTALVIDLAADLLANDLDPDSDPLTVVGMTQPANGVLMDNLDGTWTYLANANYTGPDQFQYQVSDASGAIVSATVSIDVLPVNDDPILSMPDSLSVGENTTGPVTTIQASDVDGDPISLQLGGADSGSFALDASTGEIRFNSAPDFEGPADASGDNQYRLQVTASDGAGGSVSLPITINVSDVNEAPELLSTDFTSVRGYSGSVGSLQFSDPDFGDQVQITTVGGSGTNLFSIDPTSGEITQSGDSLPGVYTLDVQLTDTQGATATGTLTITLGSLAPATQESISKFIGETETDPYNEPIDTGTTLDVDRDTGATQQESDDAVGDSTEASNENEEQGGDPSTDAGFSNSVIPGGQTNPEASSTHPQRLPGQGASYSRGAHTMVLELLLEETDELMEIALGRAMDTGLDLSSMSLSLSPSMLTALQEMRAEVNAVADQDEEKIDLLVQTGAVATLSLTAGFVTWLLRTGSLLATILSTSPLWRPFDPIPVLVDLQDASRPDPGEDVDEV